MAIKVTKSFNNSKSEGIKSNRRYDNSESKITRIKTYQIISNNILDKIRENPRFNKDNFYSLDICHLNTWLNKALKTLEEYELLVQKFKVPLEVWVDTKTIRIYHLSECTLELIIHRFKLRVNIIESGEYLHTIDLAIRQDRVKPLG